MFSNIATVLLLTTLAIAIALPFIACFLMDWKKTVLMLTLIGMAFILSVGLFVFFNILIAVVFLGSMAGLIIASVWE